MRSSHPAANRSGLNRSGSSKNRGSTYASEDYQQRLDAHGITCSMSRTGDCYDNAVMEAFFSTLKTELADRFESHDQAKRELFEYIEGFYNSRRRHSTLGQRSPDRFEQDNTRQNEQELETAVAG